MTSPPRTEPYTLRRYRVPHRVLDIGAVQPFAKCELVYDPNRDIAWTTPAPSPEELASFYRENYRKIMEKQKGLQFYSANPNYRAQAQSQINWLRDCAKSEGALLDVGAGYGLFLSEARQALSGWELYAVEPDQDAERDLRAIAILETDFEAFWRGERFVAGQFDAINLSHVLEHLLDPLEALKTLRKLLKPEGFLQVETPNDSYTELLRSDRASDLPHLWFFGQTGLETLMREAGFAICRSAVIGLERSPPPFLSIKRLRRAVTRRLAGPLSLLDDRDWYSEGHGRTDIRVLGVVPS